MNEGVIPEIAEAKRKHTSNRNKYTFSATSYLNEIPGVNITEIAGVSEITALTILSEVGTDMTRLKPEHHFTS